MVSGKDTETPTLSRRELQVLDRLARGDIDKEVAERLGITLATVRVYRKRILAKLGTQGLVSTVLVAWRLGLLDIDPIADEAMGNRKARKDRGPRG